MNSRNAASTTTCAHHSATKARSVVVSPSERSGTASALATNAPGMSPWAAASNAWAKNSVVTTSVIITRISSPVRPSVSRDGRSISRRLNM